MHKGFPAPPRNTHIPRGTQVFDAVMEIDYNSMQESRKYLRILCWFFSPFLFLLFCLFVFIGFLGGFGVLGFFFLFLWWEKRALEVLTLWDLGNSLWCVQKFSGKLWPPGSGKKHITGEIGSSKQLDFETLFTWNLEPWNKNEKHSVELQKFSGRSAKGKELDNRWMNFW